MKKYISIIILATMITTAKGSLTDGLIAHYAFEGNANDSSGNGNHGTEYNSPDYVEGVFSDAINLVGSGHMGLNGSHVLLPFIPFNESPAFTISMWVNHQGNTSTLNHGEFFLNFGDHDSQEFVAIRHSGGFPGENLLWNVGDGVVSIPYGAFANTWQHLILRADNGTMTGFLNGLSIGTSSYTLDSMYPKAGLGVHWWDGGSSDSNRFIGMMDEVRIYDRALNQDEIDILATPEPATLSLLALGGIFLRKKRKP